MTDPRVMAVAEIREHEEQYACADSYASGDRHEVFTSRILERIISASGEHYRVNIARRVIDAVLDRLEVTAVSVVEGDEESDGPTQSDADEALQTEVWDRNELDLEMPVVLRKALSYGDGYLFVWPAFELDEQPEMVTGVDIFFNDPRTMRVFYDEENPRLKVAAAKFWRVDEDRCRLTMYYPNQIERWITKKGMPGDKPSDFEPYNDPDEESTVVDGHIVKNPYGVVPVFHLRPNDRPYGRPENRDAWGPQDAVTKLLATLMTTVDYHGAPQRYALTGRKDTGEVSDLYDDEADESLKPDSHASNLKSGPGQLWLLKNVDSIGQLAPADVKAFLEPVAMYLRFASAITATPLRYFEPTGQMPSGEAQRADDAPLVKKVGGHQRNFGATLKDALEFALFILGFKDAEVSVQWAQAMTIDDLEGWQTAKAKIDAGVPVHVALMEAGYTDAQVEEWLTTNEAGDLMRQIQMLVGVGEAVQSLGAGVALGVLTAENVSRVISAVIPTDEDGGE